MRAIYLIQFALLSLSSFAQDGLEGIIIERYYVSSKSDNAGALHSGDLPEGSVTYRIYVDLKPGFTFQAAYGSPGHPLILKSTQPFFNHIEAGTTHPNILPERTLSSNIALLDSWLSVGAAGENHMGVLKEYDSDTPDEFLRFESNYFMNKVHKKDLTPRMRDGLSRSDSLPFPTFFQLDTCLLFLGSATKGNLIYTENGAWACMGKGAMGVDSLTTNTVLIAQLTTAGELSGELNLLIGAPNGTSQKYVAKNPQNGEWLHKDLILDPNKKQSHKKGKSKKRNNPINK
jgi:hypothetical protein